MTLRVNKDHLAFCSSASLLSVRQGHGLDKDIGNNFSSERVVCWHRLPREESTVPGGVQELCRCGTEGCGQWAWWADGWAG